MDAPRRPFRSGTVAVVGRPNVGKSTLLNAALGQPLAIVSPVPQTTRDAILGVVRLPRAEIALLDTPGLHRPESGLGRRMNAQARAAVERADVVVFLTDLPTRPTTRAGPRAASPPPLSGPLAVHPGDVALLGDVGAGRPTLLAVNKIDRLRDKRALLPLLAAYAALRPFEAMVPIAARTGDGVGRLLREVSGRLPEAAPRWEKDALTDRPARFLAGELVRSEVLRACRAEVPHAVAVQIDRFDESGDDVRIAATVHVERDGQRVILLGRGGERLGTIGTAARRRIGEMIGRRVHLRLWVRVTPGWRDSPDALRALGYGQEGWSPGGRGPVNGDER